MVRRTLLALLSCLVLLAVSGCSTTLHVGSLNPHPNVNLPKAASSLSLRFGDRVQDAYTVPRENGVGPTEVQQWRSSLKTAFKNTFVDSFPISESDGDLVLELQEAEVSVVPAAVTAQAAVVSGSAQIRYKAQLLDKSGKSIALTAGTVQSKNTTSEMGGASSIAQSAMESMFEAIVQRLFEQNAKGDQPTGQMMDSH
jgi:hypothetical protein